MRDDLSAVDGSSLLILAEDVEEACESTSRCLVDLAGGGRRWRDSERRLGDLSLGLAVLAARCAAVGGAGHAAALLSPVASVVAGGRLPGLSDAQRRSLSALAALCRRDGRASLSDALVDALRLVDLAGRVYSSEPGRPSGVDVVRAAAVDDADHADALCALLGLLESRGRSGSSLDSSELRGPAPGGSSAAGTNASSTQESHLDEC